MNLARTTDVLADNRELTLQTLRDLTRLAEAQNDIVFQPFRAQIDQQIRQLDAILAIVAEQREEVGVLVDWLAEFTRKAPEGHPGRLRAGLRLGPTGLPGAGAVNRRTLINLIFFNAVFALMLFWAVNNIVTFDCIEQPVHDHRRLRPGRRGQARTRRSPTSGCTTATSDPWSAPPRACG